jgi:hypothetical protein
MALTPAQIRALLSLLAAESHGHSLSIGCEPGSELHSRTYRALRERGLVDAWAANEFSPLGPDCYAFLTDAGKAEARRLAEEKKQ